jgi:hypothetical protein
LLTFSNPHAVNAVSFFLSFVQFYAAPGAAFLFCGGKLFQTPIAAKAQNVSDKFNLTGLSRVYNCSG